MSWNGKLMPLMLPWLPLAKNPFIVWRCWLMHSKVNWLATYTGKELYSCSLIGCTNTAKWLLWIGAAMSSVKLRMKILCCLNIPTLSRKGFIVLVLHYGLVLLFSWLLLAGRTSPHILQDCHAIFTLRWGGEQKCVKIINNGCKLRKS